MKAPDEPPARSHEQRMRMISLDEIISAAETGEPRVGLFRGWGMRADPSDLQTLHDRLFTAHDAEVIARYLTVFSNRAMPDFDPRLLDLCRHSDEKVRFRAFTGVAKYKHPTIRRFAISELESGLSNCSLAKLFIENYEPEDESRILDALNLPEDECELHWLLSEICDLLKKHPQADASHLGLVIYAVNPCENCRFDGLKLLQKQQKAPDWMKQEGEFDSNEECRNFVATTGRSEREAEAQARQ